MLKKFVVFKKMCNFEAELKIVEPFKERKGQPNEHKVSKHPHRAMVTVTGWLQLNLGVIIPCSNHYLHLISQAAKPA
jgi:hypothetical protein